MVAVLPFRARRRFILDGEEIKAGQVVDVSGLTPTRVRQLEATNFGMRVAAEEPDHEVVTPSPDDLPSPALGEPLPAEGLMGDEGLEEQGEEELDGLEAEGSGDEFLEIEAPASPPTTAAKPSPRASARSGKAKTSPRAKQAPGARKRS